MFRSFAFVILSLIVSQIYSQQTYRSNYIDQQFPQFSCQFSNNWTIENASDVQVNLALVTDHPSLLGLKISLAGALYKYDQGGSAMESTALSVFSRTSNINSISIDGYQGHEITTLDKYKNEERIVRNIFVDFPQYSSLNIRIAGAKVLLEKYQTEIIEIISSINLIESSINQPTVILPKKEYEKAMETNFVQFAIDSILSNLFIKKKVILDGAIELNQLNDFFKWKRNGKDSLTLLDYNNILLHLDWKSYSEFEIVDLGENQLKINLFQNKINIVSILIRIKGPKYLATAKRQPLSSFYIDYRTNKIIMNNEFVIDEKTNEILEAVYVLINGEKFPLSYLEMRWQ